MKGNVLDNDILAPGYDIFFLFFRHSGVYYRWARCYEDLQKVEMRLLIALKDIPKLKRFVMLLLTFRHIGWYSHSTATAAAQTVL